MRIGPWQMVREQGSRKLPKTTIVSRSNGTMVPKPTHPDHEADWVYRHTVEAPNAIRDFLAGDGISLEGKTVVDVGCGDGLIDWGIATSQHPQRLTGFDLEVPDTGTLLTRLRQQGLARDGLPPSLQFRDCTVKQIPAADESFDCAVSWSAFEHIHDPVLTIREVRRILRPDGFFFVQVYPFFLSEHGSHLEEWFPEGFAHDHPLDEIAGRVSPGFANEHQLKVRSVGHARHGNKRPGDEMLWDYLNLSRTSLDELHRALLQGGFWVSKAEATAPAVHLPRQQNYRSLSEMLIAGIKLIAVPNL